MAVRVVAFQQKDCLARFQQAVKKANSISKQTDKGGFELNCSIKVTMSDGTVKHEQMEIRSSKGKYLYRTGTVNIYQDMQSMVVIQNDSKKIFISKPSPLTIRKGQFDQVLSIQDSLFKYMNLRSCDKEFGVIEPDRGYTKLIFEAQEKLEHAGLNSITYWMNPENDQFKKVMIRYIASKAYGIATYELVLNTLNTQFTSDAFTNSALSFVMQKGKPVNAYASFEINDIRKK